MAKARTTTATAVEEPIVEQNIETTSVVEEPQTVSEEPQTVSEEPTVVEEGSNNETTIEGTSEGMQEGDNNGANNDTTTEPSLEDKFIEMTGINKPYAEGIMNLPNFDYYIPVGSGVNLNERNKLIAQIKDKNNPTEGE